MPRLGRGFPARAIVVRPRKVDQTITGAGGIASGEAFGAHKVNLTIAPTAIPSAEAFGTAKINLTISAAGGIASAEGFGTARIDLTIRMTGVASGEAFGTATVSTAGAAQTITGAGGIASAQAFGTATISVSSSGGGRGRRRPLRQVRFAPDYNPTLRPTQVISRAGAIASAEAFGKPQITAADPLEELALLGL